MAKFLILARGTRIPENVTPEQMQGLVKEYRGWADGLRATGRLLAAQKLRDREGKVARKPNGRLTVTDGPFAESREVIGGFWLVEAGSYDQVLRDVEKHPHLDGATLEIRQIDELMPGQS